MPLATFCFSKMPKDSTCNYVFTCNNYTDGDIQHIQGLYPKTASYVAYAQEVGEQGTPHLQGFITFTKRLGHTKAKALLPGTWCEAMKGRLDQNASYCSKQGQLVEIGTRPKERAAKRKLELAQELKSGKKWKDIVYDNTDMMLTYYRNAREIYNVVGPHDR